ncbi:MAG: ABC transporter ATP-binding protein [Lachnospiraceae bacterium]|nr:ABC transporter ATP-binding protein [Lachnospiraceae bacterium]
MLEVTNVNKNYGKKQVLYAINLKFENGIYGLLGPNGAGKTTLIHIITGLIPPSGGKVTYRGTDIRERKNRYHDDLGFMPQYTSYYPNFTGMEFLNYMCTIKGIPARKQKEIISEVLRIVNLTEHRNEKIGHYSGGMKQRIGIAQAIINNPKILILDEPTAGLDPLERIRFRNLISELSKDRVVILATHIVPDVESIASKVLLLHKGRLIEGGSPEKLMNDLDGRVALITTECDCKTEIEQEYHISNVVVNNNKYQYRIISDKTLPANAVLVAPTLEDVFLLHTQSGEEV